MRHVYLHANKIIKDNVSKSQFVTTNFMNGHTDVDPWRNPDLDFISYTMYPVAGYTEGVGDQGSAWETHGVFRLPMIFSAR